MPEIVQQPIAKGQRRRRSLSENSQREIEAIAGMDVPAMIEHWRDSDPRTLADRFADKVRIAEILDRKDGGRQPMLISRHEDAIRRVEIGYGNAERPEDYLDGFGAFLRENLNKIPALLVAVQRPRDLTRQQLKELRSELERAEYRERFLQTARREITNEDIAASIIGFIRQAALGEPLISYSVRVDRAIASILASRNWTPVQRQWRERIGQQLNKEIVVDRAAFETGQFKEQGGGFARLDRVFDGELEGIIGEISDRIWRV